MRNKIFEKLREGSLGRFKAYPLDYLFYYYSLIRFPDGSHFPLPLALKKEIITWNDIKKIPISRKKRDGLYFTCFCGCKSFWHCKGWWYSSEMQERESKIKEVVLRRLIVNGQHKRLRIVVPDFKWLTYRAIPIDALHLVEPCPNCPWVAEDWSESYCSGCLLKQREG